jgi:peptidoglycan/LPS O-acetylase OafA/YrhL
MTVLFFGSVFVIHDLTLSEGLKSYLASITYTHNFVYGSSFHPLINSPAWSLEIEIQFYILAP